MISGSLLNLSLFNWSMTGGREGEGGREGGRGRESEGGRERGGERVREGGREGGGERVRGRESEGESEGGREGGEERGREEGEGKREDNKVHILQTLNNNHKQTCYHKLKSPPPSLLASSKAYFDTCSRSFPSVSRPLPP